MHHEVMNHYDDAEPGTRLLPGVDLTLWLQIVVAVLFVIAAAGLVLALA